MTQRSLWLFVLSTCMSCGAHSSSEPPNELESNGGVSDSASAGAQAGAGGSWGDAGSHESGGAPSLEGDTGGVSSDAGEPGYMPHIGSGTRNCENDTYCFGLSCYAPPSFDPTVCVARCETDWDCEPSETCVRSARLEPTCYARCDSPSDCEYHFDCVDFSGEGRAVCFPAAWASRRQELGD